MSSPSHTSHFQLAPLLAASASQQILEPGIAGDPSNPRKLQGASSAIHDWRARSDRGRFPAWATCAMRSAGT